MITYYPSYYKDFKCIASKCKTSCCSAGWEICIDEETANFYKSIPGIFGNKLREKIDYNGQAKFILTSDGRCPFLNEDNLCDIYTTLGEKYLCQICTEHPRFYECFNDIIECGIGIYCEEACRIILSQEKDFTMYEEETNEIINLDYNKKVFKYLYENRSKIFKYLSDKSLSINQRVADILWFANILQQNIDSDMLDEEDIFSVSSTTEKNIEPIINYLLSLEPNDTKWFDYLNESLKIYTDNLDKYDTFVKENPNVSMYIQNLAIYYIYRYFLRGIYDEDVLSRVKFMAISVAIINILFFCEWIKKDSALSIMDCVWIAKKYAEEIECNDDNVMNLHIASYKMNAFSIENLLGLFI